MYTSLARLYDRLMDDVDYSAWADYYIRLLRVYGGEISSVYECACGTGSLTRQLAKYPVKLTASDISEDMLREAAEKARKNGIKVPFIKQDMRHIDLPRRVNGVIAACDGVNYLTDEESLDSFISTAFEALKPGGTLAFDISTVHKFNEMSGRVYCDERDDAACIWSCNFENSLLTMDVSLYVRQPGGLYERLGERHTQKGHTTEDIISALEKGGFTDIRAYGGMTFDAPRADDDRIHFAARRPL